MSQLKVFISYCHKDEGEIEEFIKKTAPLRNKGLIDHWYDRKIICGNDYQKDIDNNLEDSDIICLFISDNFLASNACMKELKVSRKLNIQKGIPVIPIILNNCGWLDIDTLNPKLAIPTDGKPISKYEDRSDGWMCVYENLKLIIEREIMIRNMKLTHEFKGFINDVDLLTKAHPNKEKITLDDIYIHHDLRKFDYLNEHERCESSEILITSFLEIKSAIVEGDNQSGKTSLCKTLIKELLNHGRFPIYLTAKSNHFKGSLYSMISHAFKRQFDNLKIEDVDLDNIAVIIDDFHYCRNKEKIISELDEYYYRFITVDDIFSFNLRNEALISSYFRYKMLELRPTLRNNLVKKWNEIGENESGSLFNDNKKYKDIDSKLEVVNATLGKIIGNGIMPAYPFFILSIISTHESFYSPLEKEITSQGHCYQAFIYIYLKKQNVKNDEIDIYINFLTELSYFFFNNDTIEININDFNDFLSKYVEKFNLPIDSDKLISTLTNALIVRYDSFNNLSFNHKYIYYFFVAKYLAENISENKNVIGSIFRNLHIDENAYIAIFISHHTNSDLILDEIILNAACLFDSFEPTTLKVDELKFFDKQCDSVVQAALPSSSDSPEKNRAELLAHADEAETKIKNQSIKDKLNEEDVDFDLAVELRRSIKTVEVMGRIIKNRAGSLTRSRLEYVFEEAMKVHLRILKSFFELIENEEGQDFIIDFLGKNIDKIIKKKDRIPSGDKLKKLCNSIFWNVNFFTVYGFFDKMIHSLGSNKLLEIVKNVCDREDTPASFILKHGIYMWYSKNLQIENIHKKINGDGFSRTAKKVMEFLIVHHCSMHHVNYKDIQRISDKFNLDSKTLLINQAHIDG